MARSFGDDFVEFLLKLNVEYFGDKMFSGMAYVVCTKSVRKACYKFALQILPALQEELKKEKENK